MSLEDLTGDKYIDDLVSTNPANTDNKSEGAAHIRGVKNVLKTTFPSITGPITANQAELNVCDGLTASTAELNTLDGITASTAELNKMDGVTASTSEINLLDGLSEVPNYSSTSVTLDGDFTSGSLSLVRIGDAVTITAPTAGHSAGIFAFSSSGLIPAAYRPAENRYSVVSATSNEVIGWKVETDGTFAVYHYDWAGAGYSESSILGGSITYIV